MCNGPTYSCQTGCEKEQNGWEKCEANLRTGAAGDLFACRRRRCRHRRTLTEKENCHRRNVPVPIKGNNWTDGMSFLVLSGGERTNQWMDGWMDSWTDTNPRTCPLLVSAR